MKLEPRELDFWEEYLDEIRDSSWDHTGSWNTKKI